MRITPGFIEYTGESVAKYGLRQWQILRNLLKALNLPEIDCSPSLAVELHQICLKPLYEVTRDCNASDHLTSLMHWGPEENGPGCKLRDRDVSSSPDVPDAVQDFYHLF